jgi:hypothetical protein
MADWVTGLVDERIEIVPVEIRPGRQAYRQTARGTNKPQIGRAIIALPSRIGVNVND